MINNVHFPQNGSTDYNVGFKDRFKEGVFFFSFLEMGIVYTHGTIKDCNTLILPKKKGLKVEMHVG